MRLTCFLILLSCLLGGEARAQSENVPVEHPVYTFLKRMEVKGLIERYHDAVLPLSRREIAVFLSDIDTSRSRLTEAEQGWLQDFLSEFRFDITGTTQGFHSLIESGDSTIGADLAAALSNREKFLYQYHDSAAALFANGLLDVDARSITGDALGRQHAEFVQPGFRLRGTLLGHLGYFMQETNAQFWGSRDLLLRDPILRQSHELSAGTNVHNFDFGEGYVRYDGGIVSAQLGRERVLWGYGFDQQMTLSDNPREFDFIRADVQYKALKYTFMHAWLLGSESELVFSLPSDTSAKFTEPVIADKYLAAHRFELSFPSVITVGFQEMYIYSNRAPDLGYFNPFIFLESVQRSRGDRDNGFWSFDCKTHFLQNVQLTGTILFDDINLPDLFTRVWTDRYAWQMGMTYADPFLIANSTLMVEYTNVQPYVFSHGRSRDDSYTSLGDLLGPRIGPNAESWSLRGDYLPLRNLMFSVRVTFERKGENVVDSTGQLITNVGGDPLQPHRDSDPLRTTFLAGNLVRTRNLQLMLTWEMVNQLWLDVSYRFDSTEQVVPEQWNENHTMDARVRMEF